MRFEVYGREIQVERSSSGWRVWYPGTGTHRPAEDLVIPAEVTPDEIACYLADLCHEWSRPGADSVRMLDPDQG